MPIAVSTDDPVDGSVAVRATDGVSGAGRIEIEIGTARMVVTGGVEPALSPLRFEDRGDRPVS